MAEVPKSPKPLQGLKRLSPNRTASSLGGSKKPETLTGIETQENGLPKTGVTWGRYVPKSLKPLQGLKQIAG